MHLSIRNTQIALHFKRFWKRTSGNTQKIDQIEVSFGDRYVKWQQKKTTLLVKRHPKTENVCSWYFPFWVSTKRNKKPS